ncbi:MAG: dethiobiotin synthase [Methylotenera sp.]|nr:dethiobiotin synthase [Methylotenera sp.]
MQAGYFVVGTDTDVGKTYVAVALLRHFVAQGYQAVGMKPLASGCKRDANGQLINDDVMALQLAGNVQADIETINPYRFLPAIAPHIAAQQVGIQPDIKTILNAYQSLKAKADVVVVEGAGGFMTPINDRQTLADVAVALAMPMVLVVGMRLGCINHALLTVEAMQARGLHLAGWVANSPAPTAMAHLEENLSSLQQSIAAPCLSVVPWQAETRFNLP